MSPNNVFAPSDVRGFWRAVSWPVGSSIDQNTVAYGSEDDLALFERSRIGSERTTWVLASPKPGDTVTVLESILGPGDVVTGAWIGRLARHAAPLAAKIAGRVYWIARCTGPSAKQVLVLAVSHDQVFTAIRRQGHDGSEPLDRGQYWLATRVEDDAEVQGKFDKVLLDDGTTVPLSTVIEAQVRHNVFAPSERARQTPSVPGVGPLRHAAYKADGVPLEIHRLPPVEYIVESFEALQAVSSRVSGHRARVTADDSLYVQEVTFATPGAGMGYRWIKLEGAQLDEARNHGREWAVVLAVVQCEFPRSWTPYEYEDVVLGCFETQERARGFLDALVALGAMTEAQVRP